MLLATSNARHAARPRIRWNVAYRQYTARREFEFGEASRHPREAFPATSRCITGGAATMVACSFLLLVVCCPLPCLFGKCLLTVVVTLYSSRHYTSHRSSLLVVFVACCCCRHLRALFLVLSAPSHSPVPFLAKTRRNHDDNRVSRRWVSLDGYSCTAGLALPVALVVESLAAVETSLFFLVSDTVECFSLSLRQQGRRVFPVACSSLIVSWYKRR